MGFGEALLDVGLSIVGGLIARDSEKDAIEEQERANEQALKITEEMEQESRAFQQEQFDKQLARQQPYLDVGTQALPDFAMAVQNRGREVALPVSDIRQGLLSDFLGPNAPDFIREEAMGNIEAEEEQANIGRLANLVDLGLGGSGDVAAATTGLASGIGRSYQTEQAAQGNKAQALQNAAYQRSNLRGQTMGGLAGIPGLMVSAGMFDQAPSPYSSLVPSNPSLSPYTTTQNPLGLTPGQGL